MMEALARLVRLQELHSERERLQAELAGIPAHRAEAERELETFKATLQSFEGRTTDLRKELRSGEVDVKGIKDEISKYESQLLSVKTNEAYRALMEEVAAAKRKIRGVEDRMLEKMDEEESARHDVEAKKKDEPTVRERIAAIQKELDAEEARVRARLAEIGAAWESEKATVSAKDLDVFTRLVKSRHGVAVSRLDGETCEECSLLVRPQLAQEVKRGDAMHYCENCSRILFWEPGAEEVI